MLDIEISYLQQLNNSSQIIFSIVQNYSCKTSSLLKFIAYNYNLLNNIFYNYNQDFDFSKKNITNIYFVFSICYTIIALKFKL